jgi:hypothetical protein
MVLAKIDVNEVSYKKLDVTAGFVYFCGPSCQHKHKHNFQYDFTKSFQNKLVERPGIDFFLDPKI